MDRWSIVTTLNYLPHDKEVDIVSAKAKHYRHGKGRDIVNKMVRVADLTRARLHEWRPVDRDEPAHGHHLGRERRDLQGYRLRLPRHLPQQMRRSWSARSWPEFYQRCFGEELTECRPWVLKTVIPELVPRISTTDAPRNRDGRVDQAMYVHSRIGHSPLDPVNRNPRTPPKDPRPSR